MLRIEHLSKSYAKGVFAVRDLSLHIEKGDVFEGKVARIMDFGAFVELPGGKEGLVHISQIAHERTNKVTDVLNIGDTVKVKVTEIDKMGRINLSRKALLPRPKRKFDKKKTESTDEQ